MVYSMAWDFSGGQHLNQKVVKDITIEVSGWKARCMVKENSLMLTQVIVIKVSSRTIDTPIHRRACSTF